jgi:hypothetical protein
MTTRKFFWLIWFLLAVSLHFAARKSYAKFPLTLVRSVDQSAFGARILSVLALRSL